jgi:hypothetical protein
MNRRAFIGQPRGPSTGIKRPTGRSRSVGSRKLLTSCGRERADEFDILVAGFSKESTRLSGSGGERVQ